MKALARLFWTLVVLAAPLVAQQPPLIDRELFFGDPEIAGAQISPDGKYIAFLKPPQQDSQRLGQENRGAFQRRQATHQR